MLEVADTRLGKSTGSSGDGVAGISSWLDFAAKTQHSLHFQNNPQEVYLLPFDLLSDPDLTSLVFLTKCYHDELLAILKGADKRLGFVTDTHIVLRLQTTLVSSKGNLLFTPIQRFDELVARQFSESPLTRAEKSTLLQIVCGDSLKSAAAAGGTSYETKRVQAKSILKKSGMKRQVEVSNYFVAQLVMDSSSKTNIDSSFEPHRSFAQYVERFLPTEVRSHTILGRDVGLLDDPSLTLNGRDGLYPSHHRFLDMGPIDGTPFLMMHGLVLPHITDETLRFLHSRNMRLIWPLRNGALGPSDNNLGFAEHVRHSVASIELAREFLPDNFAAVVSIGCAAHYSVLYAGQYPDTAEKYVFIAPTGNQARKLVPASADQIELDSLTSYNSLRANYFLSLTGNSIIDRSHLKKLLLDAYSSSPADQAAIRNEFLNPQCAESLMYQFESSSISIDHDCGFHIAPEWMLAKAIKQPLHIIHGEADGIDNINQIKQLAEQINSSFTPVPQAGKLISHSHMIECLKKLHELV